MVSVHDQLALRQRHHGRNSYSANLVRQLAIITTIISIQNCLIIVNILKRVYKTHFEYFICVTIFNVKSGYFSISSKAVLRKIPSEFLHENF